MYGCFEYWFNAYKSGRIPEEEWLQFCNWWFEKILTDNEDVLRRLKSI